MQEKDEITLINYIKDSIDVLILTSIEQKVNDYNEQRENTQQEYEPLLIKLEKEIREHIQLEHQLKLFIDNLQSNYEELEQENLILKGNNKNIFRSNSISVINENQNIITNLKIEIESYKKILKSYEAQNLKLSENERKIKNLLLNERKLFNKKENTYIDEIKSLKKKLRLYEQKLSLLCSEDNNRFFNNNLNSYRSCDNENSSKKIIRTINLNSEKKSSMTHRTNYETKKYGNNSVLILLVL